MSFIGSLFSPPKPPPPILPPPAPTMADATQSVANRGIAGDTFSRTRKTGGQGDNTKTPTALKTLLGQ